MPTPSRFFPALAGCTCAAVCGSSAAQVVTNGDFESGSMSPWTSTNTPSGQTYMGGLVSFDIDGPGPLPTSNCARVMTGQGAPNTGHQGVTIHQTVYMEAGTLYNASFNWATHALVGAAASSGMFQIVIDGTPVTEVVAPVLGPNQRAYGLGAGGIYVNQSGEHEVGVRITRTISAGYEVFQHIDNITVVPTCDPIDFNNDGLFPDTQDIDDFLGAFAGGLCPACNDIDFNNDGLFPDTLDIETLLSVFAGQSCI